MNTLYPASDFNSAPDYDGNNVIRDIDTREHPPGTDDSPSISDKREIVLPL